MADADTAPTPAATPAATPPVATLAERFKPTQTKVVNATRQLSTLRFSPCGKLLLAVGQDNLIRRWDLATAELPELPPLGEVNGVSHNGWIEGLALDGASGRMFTADSWGKLCARPYADPAPQVAWQVEAAHNGWIRQLALSPDGALLASCGRDGMVRIWNAADGAKKHELAGHNQDVYSIAFHPDGKTLVSGDLRGVIKQWDLASGQHVRDLDANVFFSLQRLQDVGGVRCLAFDPAGKTLYAAGIKPNSGGFVEGIPYLLPFNWETGAPGEGLELGKKEDGFVHDLVFHREGFLVLVTSGQPGKGQLLCLQPGEKTPFFTTNAMPNCHSVGLHPDGFRLAIVSVNGGSNGNGRQLDKDGKYPGNFSPVHLWEFPRPAQPASS